MGTQTASASQIKATIEIYTRHARNFNRLGKVVAATQMFQEIAELRRALAEAEAAVRPTHHTHAAPNLYRTSTSSHYLAFGPDGTPVRACNWQPTADGEPVYVENGHPVCRRCTGAHLHSTHFGR